VGDLRVVRCIGCHYRCGDGDETCENDGCENSIHPIPPDCGEPVCPPAFDWMEEAE
jgi:hypothetical protein